jgi:hypothetical protein
VYLILAAVAPAQRLYNADQDKRAQEALKAGKDLSPAAGFTSALENLSQVWMLRQEQVFRTAHTQMRADLGSWITWGDLKVSVQQTADSLKPLLATGKTEDLEKKLDSAKAAQTAAKQALAEFAKTVSESPAAGVASVGTWLDRVSQIGPVADYLINLEKDKSASKAQIDAAGKASDGLQKLAKLYTDFKLDLPKNPHALLLEYQLQALALEVQHVREDIQIQERLDRELKITTDVLQPVQADLAALSLPNDERIADRLDRLAAAKNDAELRRLIFLLYNAAALAARGNTPKRLADLRIAMEERAHSLRLAGGATAFHQQIVVNGLERLALYYQGGVKAASIADLIQALATVGIAPAVWTK